MAEMSFGARKSTFIQDDVGDHAAQNRGRARLVKPISQPANEAIARSRDTATVPGRETVHSARGLRDQLEEICEAPDPNSKLLERQRHVPVPGGAPVVVVVPGKRHAYMTGSNIDAIPRCLTDNQAASYRVQFWCRGRYHKITATGAPTVSQAS